MIPQEDCWHNIEQLLKCPLCAETFKEPKLLSCGHRFCGNHLINSENVSISCFICAKNVTYIDCKNTELLFKVMFTKKQKKGNTKKVTTPRSSVDAFDLILPIENRRKWSVGKTYIRKSKLIENDKKKILPFQNNDTKEMIQQWLSNTQNLFQRMTQSQEIYDFCEDDINTLSLPSVSQNNTKNTKAKSESTKHHINLRSGEVLHLRSRKIKRPHSLNLKRVKTPVKLKSQNLSFNSVSYNYNIEEFDTGPKISVGMDNPAVHKDIIQQMEDDFLDSIETEVDITKYNRKTINNCDETVPSSGWDRLKQMKKSVCKEAKAIKKIKKLVQVNTSIRTTESDHLKTRKKDLNIATKDKVKSTRKLRGKNMNKKSKNNIANSAENAAVEFIDLTIAPSKQNNEEPRNENCELIIKDTKQLENVPIQTDINQENIQQIEEPLISKDINICSKTAENTFSLNLPTNLDQINLENDIEEIFLLATPKSKTNNEILVNNNNEGLYDQVAKNVTNLDIVQLSPQTSQESENLQEYIKSNPDFSKSAIPLEIGKLKKLIQNSTNLEEKNKNTITSKLEDILLLLLNNLCIENNKYLSPKIFVSLGIQTDAPLEMKSIDIQTDCLNNISKSTQTSQVLNLEKGLQTSQIDESKVKVDFGVQTEDINFEKSPEREVIDSIIEKYLGSNDILIEDNDTQKHEKGTSQSKFKSARILDNLDSSLEDLENIPKNENNYKKNHENKNSDTTVFETQYTKTFLSENIITPSPKNQLNEAIILMGSENTFSKPNSPAKKIENSPRTQVENSGIISQTQLSIKIMNKKAAITPKPVVIESIGIISQTQLNRSPIKPFKARLKTPSQIKVKSVEDAELSDSFENLEYNTADILAGGEVSFHNKSPSTQISKIEISVDSKINKVNQTLVFDKNHARRMKRIRFPDDTDSDDEQPKPKKRGRNKFVRDDLSIEFRTEGLSSTNDDMLPEELPDVCDSDLADDFNFEECIRNIEKKFDPNANKPKTPQKIPYNKDKPSTSKFLIIKANQEFDIPIKNTPDKNIKLKAAQVDDTIMFKSPVKRAKRSILSEIICPKHSERSPGKIQVLDNVIVQKAVNKSFESDHDLDDVICSDESMEENTKLRTYEPDLLWGTPEKDNTNKQRESPFKLPSLGETPDMFNLPSPGEDILLAPPPEFANSDSENVFTENVLRSAQDPIINSTVNSFMEIKASDTSTQQNKLDEKQDYDILSLSPIKPTVKLDKGKNIDSCPLTIIKRDKPKAKPLNLTNHRTPKVKQNSIFSYIKRTQNRTHLNTSSTGLFKDTEDLINITSKDDSQTIQNLDKPTAKNIPCVACSRLNKDDIKAITCLVRKKLITFNTLFEKSVTHLIVSVNKNNFVMDHTMKYLSAVSMGIWILNSDWIKECIKSNKIVKEDDYEVLDVSGSDGPQKSRLFREIRPLLYNFRILAAPPFRCSERSVIEDVIRNLGGLVVDNAIEFCIKNDKIDLVISEASSTQSFLLDDDLLSVYKVGTVDIEWLSHSVGQYKILSFLPFLLCDADEIENLNVYPPEFLVDIPGFTFSTQPATQ